MSQMSEVTCSWNGPDPGTHGFLGAFSNHLVRNQLTLKMSSVVDPVATPNSHQRLAEILLSPVYNDGVHAITSRALVAHRTGSGKTLLVVRLLDGYIQDPRPKIVIVPETNHIDEYIRALMNPLYPNAYQRFVRDYFRQVPGSVYDHGKTDLRKYVDNTTPEGIQAVLDTLRMLKRPLRDCVGTPGYPAGPLTIVKYTIAGGHTVIRGYFDDLPTEPFFRAYVDRTRRASGHHSNNDDNDKYNNDHRHRDTTTRVQTYDQAVVIMDECHRMHDGRIPIHLREKLTALEHALFHARGSVVVGLTATPLHVESEDQFIAYSTARWALAQVDAMLLSVTDDDTCDDDRESLFRHGRFVASLLSNRDRLRAQTSATPFDRILRTIRGQAMATTPTLEGSVACFFELPESLYPRVFPGNPERVMPFVHRIPLRGQNEERAARRRIQWTENISETGLHKRAPFKAALGDGTDIPDPWYFESHATKFDWLLRCLRQGTADPHRTKMKDPSRICFPLKTLILLDGANGFDVFCRMAFAYLGPKIIVFDRPESQRQLPKFNHPDNAQGDLYPLAIANARFFSESFSVNSVRQLILVDVPVDYASYVQRVGRVLRSGVYHRQLSDPTHRNVSFHLLVSILPPHHYLQTVEERLYARLCEMQMHYRHVLDELQTYSI